MGAVPVPLPPARLRAGPWPPARTTARWLLNFVQGCPQRSIFGAPQTSRLETWVRGDASRAEPEFVRHAPQPPGRQLGVVVWPQGTPAGRRPCPTSVPGAHLPYWEVGLNGQGRPDLPDPVDPSGLTATLVRS